MSVVMQARGDLGGVAAHLQCPHCGFYSKSHAHQLSHIAASHPTHLEGAAFGRLGNILMYQSTAQLFHCFDCFFTSKDFTKVYKHVITKHCMDEREAATEETSEKGPLMTAEQRKEEEKEEGEGGIKRKQSSKVEEDVAKMSCLEEQRGEEGDKPTTCSEGKDEVEEAGHRDNGDASQMADKTDGERDESVLIFDGVSFCCMMCSWKSKLKGVAINHVVRRHDIPRAYAIQAIKRDAAAEEDEEAGLSSELLRVEMEATAKVIRFVSSRFVCQICGWKTKLKGLAITHVERSHNVERPYNCKDCHLTFFLPSRLQQHMTSAHRPGRYICPFCCFRSHFLGGFKRHCSRCNAWEGRGEGDEGKLGERRGGEEDDHECDKKGERKGGRTRRKTAKMINEEKDKDDD
ncbi:chromosome alignment-maintaining phosphoprotein 1 [Takifugu rubripes]|nr:chromosome alignment-maintaining phosphoprotein 1 [Takifugu rubripes]|eukprot:XP_011604624.1 PREDICTED: chromosome alignment-maintaining phosphoprotein 1 [Takifugu rubripes]